MSSLVEIDRAAINAIARAEIAASIQGILGPQRAEIADQLAEKVLWIVSDVYQAGEALLRDKELGNLTLEQLRERVMRLGAVAWRAPSRAMIETLRMITAKGDSEE